MKAESKVIMHATTLYVRSPGCSSFAFPSKIPLAVGFSLATLVWPTVCLAKTFVDAEKSSLWALSAKNKQEEVTTLVSNVGGGGVIDPSFASASTPAAKSNWSYGRKICSNV